MNFGWSQVGAPTHLREPLVVTAGLGGAVMVRLDRADGISTFGSGMHDGKAMLCLAG